MGTCCDRAARVERWDDVRAFPECGCSDRISDVKDVAVHKSKRLEGERCGGISFWFLQ